MGQHKYNPTAIAAKNGELPPKSKQMSKRDRDRMLQGIMMRAMMEKTGLAGIMRMTNIRPYDEADRMLDMIQSSRRNRDG